MPPSPLESLLLYQDTAEHLEYHPFIRFRRSRDLQLSTTWSAPGKVSTIKAVHPAEAIIAGYTGQIRGFFLNDDDWTIHRMPNIYHKLGASGFWKYHLKKARKEFEKFKKERTRVALPNRENTKWNAFELFLYGQVIHRTKATDLDIIKKDSFHYEFFLMVIMGILWELTHFVRRIYHLNNWVQFSLKPKPKLP
ncbi:hypothetical protein [Pelagicoccus albus]|uniref:Uncharacterized protein n=1 Tax=Pelagicoccus albus TaxID=415222 RepID=A0A7X1B7C4_9BACT|nr:hypothetical protein [Pelagicoccus albus]MBC2605743.1 hypothetical protein [Pelagicoccus albus]